MPSERLVCSVGGRRPTEVIARSLVAWIAECRETETLESIDKAIIKDGERAIGP
jgi:hypothetical protein